MQPYRSLLIVCSFLVQCVRIHTAMRLVCYYTNWSVYRHMNTPILYPDAIDPVLCTHLHIAFAVINPITLKIEPSEKHDTQYTDVFHMPLYMRMHKLKRRNSSLKLLVAVGGWTAASEAFNNVIANETNRAIFIQQTKEFLYEWNFDGIDLDWEFPGDAKRGAVNNSREQFNVLVQEMSEAFQNENPRLLLTAAVTADPTKVDQGYVVADFCRYLDYVSVMTYDYHGAWDNVTGINAPLYARLDDEDEDGQWKNVNHSIHYWLNEGCPASKLNLGLAAYGRSFTLANDSKTMTIGADSTGAGLAGPFTKENGTLAYFEICQKLRLYNWSAIYDNESQVPYAYSPVSNSLGRQWVGYDDFKSITQKVMFAKALNLGGAMIWSLDQDDYTGLYCRQGMFPLIKRIHELLSSSNRSYEQNSSSSTKPSSSSPKNKVTSMSIHGFTSSSSHKITPTHNRFANGNQKNHFVLHLIGIGLLISRF